MNKLNTYINESLSYEYLDFMKEDAINEGKIKDGIQKLWNYLKNKFTRKKLSDDEIKHPKLDTAEYSYNKVTKKISKIKFFKDLKFDNISSDVKVLLTYFNENEVWEGLFIYVPYNKSPYSKVSDVKKYNYIYGFKLSDTYSKIKDKIFLNYVSFSYKKINNEEGKSDGFMISSDTYNTDTDLYDKLGFESKKFIYDNNKITVYIVKYKNLKSKISENLLNNIDDKTIFEELDDNMFYLLDMWFNHRENELTQFINLLVQCKKDKITDPKKLEQYIKGTFLETQLYEFIDFLENDIIPNTQKNYLYSLKKIIDTIMFDKTNKKYHKEES